MLLVATATTEATKVVFDLPPQALAAAGLLLGLSFLVSIGAGIATIWDKTRKKPSSGEELASYRQEVSRTFASKQELNDAEDRLSKLIETAQHDRRESLKQVETQVFELRKTMDQGFAEVRRALGRVEGILEVKLDK